MKLKTIDSSKNWNYLIKGVENFEDEIIGCDRKGCEKGKIKTPKEFGIGYKIAFCYCYEKYELLRESEELLEESNLPPLFFKNNSLDEYKPMKSILQFENLRKAIEKEKWMYLTGKPGTGKTFLSRIICALAIIDRKSVYYTTVADLLNNLRPESDVSRAELWDKIRNSDVVVLDDIGQEKTSQWVREQMYIAINGRYDNGLMTIITSNKPMESLRRDFSEAIYSRVKGESLEINFNNQVDKRLT